MKKTHIKWGVPKQARYIVHCSICNKVLEGLWCTSNVCQECCEAGKCILKLKCKAYPTVLEDLLKKRSPEEVIANPSKRVKYK